MIFSPFKKLLALGFITALTLSSCDQSIERRLIGRWDYTESGVYIVNSIFVSDTNKVDNGATLTFKAGGAGTYFDSDSTYQMEWATTEEEVTLSIDTLDPVIYEIILNTDDQQFWIFEKEENSSTNGVDIKEEWSSSIQLRKLN